ncbi:hypothetical protein H8K32_01200 [Undibacterium jejuense]|uniref:Uncharacterized protein n=1 Tax=Undibacterium jejuense TaxID=1344949 RepID=A0A923KMA3_9BURK|nr:hypothetical protein [Undibacterium jejuense]MBC3860698.1 hypothetical protein [Undibacterium jejuense]
MNLPSARILILLTTIVFFNSAYAQESGFRASVLLNNKELRGWVHSDDRSARTRFFSSREFGGSFFLRAGGKSTANSPQNVKPKEKKSKLTPEERRALRQQVRDVEQELHPPKK